MAYGMVNGAFAEHPSSPLAPLFIVAICAIVANGSPLAQLVPFLQMNCHCAVGSIDAIRSSNEPLIPNI